MFLTDLGGSSALQSFNFLFNRFEFRLQIPGVFLQLINLLGLREEASSEIVFVPVHAAFAMPFILPIVHITRFAHSLPQLLTYSMKSKVFKLSSL